MPKAIALTTALFAALVAVAALRAGGTVNEALVIKTEATRLRAKLRITRRRTRQKESNQRFNRRPNHPEVRSASIRPPSLSNERQRYAREQTELAQLAREKERERDQKSTEADHLLHRHHRFADSVALFQVAIALGAVAALTRMRLVWYSSIVVGLSGAGLFILAIL